MISFLYTDVRPPGTWQTRKQAIMRRKWIHGKLFKAVADVRFGRQGWDSTIRKVIRQVSRNEMKATVCDMRSTLVLSSEFRSQEKVVMGLHEEGKFWKSKEYHGAMQQLQRVPHVVFVSLRNIEIFEEVILLVSLKTTNHRCRKLSASRPHELRKIHQHLMTKWP